MEYDFTEWQPNKCIVLCGFFTHFVRCGPHVNEKKKIRVKDKQKRERKRKKNTNITSTIRKSECSAIPFAIATNLTGIKCCDKFQYKEKRSKQIKSKSSIAMAQTCYLTIRNRSSLNDRKAYKANAENGNNSCVSMTRN